MLDFKLPSKWYRRAVGASEIILGLALAAAPNHKVKNAANIGLVLLMVLAAYSHVMVGDPFDRCAPALVFFFMLSGRLVVCMRPALNVVPRIYQRSALRLPRRSHVRARSVTKLFSRKVHSKAPSSRDALAQSPISDPGP
ncbi:Transmembrane protein 35A [Eumeta japonica]|uniref:Novel acetylcholine receptor chaperone n=1 Tax=Eumeta variegata TaxID=151549 RepID=A0A4C1ZDA4_EUMVA|nr:Transmembrane protein 35A [Eumeta japonica]